MPFGARAAARRRRALPALGAGAQRASSCCSAPRPMPARRPCARRSDGWFELDVPRAAAGTRYRFRIDGELLVPDPASRFNPDDVQRPSARRRSARLRLARRAWRGRPWHEAVIYETARRHASRPRARSPRRSSGSTISPTLGITAIELMPRGRFPGRRGWGYDGVLPFAPDAALRHARRPEARWSHAAHARGLMVLLDVVYNHFGPDGNYLHALRAASSSTDVTRRPGARRSTSTARRSRTVRDFFIHNALYWLEEYHFDGLRLDAVHAIADDSHAALPRRARAGACARPGGERHVHLVLENDRNDAHRLARDAAARRALRRAVERRLPPRAARARSPARRDGYYADYADEPLRAARPLPRRRLRLPGRAVAATATARRAASASAGLPPLAFVNFLQNHDQVGNRAFGERLRALAPSRRAARARDRAACCSRPRCRCCSWARSSRRGDAVPVLLRLRPASWRAPCATAGATSSARFARFADPQPRAADSRPERRRRPSSAASSTGPSARSRRMRAWLALYRRAARAAAAPLMPLLGTARRGAAHFDVEGAARSRVRWPLGDGCTLHLLANLADAAADGDRAASRRGRSMQARAAAPLPRLVGARLVAASAPWRRTRRSSAARRSRLRHRAGVRRHLGPPASRRPQALTRSAARHAASTRTTSGDEAAIAAPSARALAAVAAGRWSPPSTPAELPLRLREALADATAAPGASPRTAGRARRAAAAPPSCASSRARAVGTALRRARPGARRAAAARLPPAEPATARASSAAAC